MSDRQDPPKTPVSPWRGGSWTKRGRGESSAGASPSSRGAFANRGRANLDNSLGMASLSLGDRERTPATPPSPTRGTRSPLSNLFARPEGLERPTSSSSAQTPPIAGFTNALRTSTWSKLPGGFPNWSTSRRADGGLSPLQLALVKARVNKYDADEPFKTAANEIVQIKKLVEKNVPGTDKALETSMCDIMSLLVFGSNVIEHVGFQDKRITVKLCEAVFVGQRSQLDTIPARSDAYWQLLDKMSREGTDQRPANIRSRKECINHAAAFLEITNVIVKEGEPFTEDLIKNVHKILCHGQDLDDVGGRAWNKYAGLYRSNPERDVVSAGGNFFTLPIRVAGKMTEWVEKLVKDLRDAELSRTIDPFAIAADAAGDFVNIHPFMDGNGRMSRLIAAAITIKYTGTCTPIGEGDSRQEYMNIAVERSQNHEGNGLMAALLLKHSVSPLKSLRVALEGVAKR